MSDFIVKASNRGTTIKLHRGERKCLVGFDLDRENATDDFVGFALEFRLQDPEVGAVCSTGCASPMRG